MTTATTTTRLVQGRDWEDKTVQCEYGSHFHLHRWEHEAWKMSERYPGTDVYVVRLADGGYYAATLGALNDPAWQDTYAGHTKLSRFSNGDGYCYPIS